MSGSDDTSVQPPAVPCFGLACPVCKSVNLSVRWSIPHRGTRRRYRLCADCQNHFITAEIIIRPSISKSSPTGV